ncbi:prepilin-type N-terminal cleavage/methylation domain-containing protein [Coraliomargarita sp. SDUM461003]|uniref:Prepilin-type N-terminal cleavage/methylation domain-containing protein n=1 Tax=Thalassobacterium maritimum TaxID=3041265 RepID=A0ABU1AYA3_9BACT|nr:prepilin-type N-terminal cleavage/methylation domain-containing protein [Coraliomargarita sp. SDUM461003]MDQ8209126.1 prepilin-type N-terminal cleavage/methylation domain-containing protein [Coraliomargarita sp. SDUM461003]
MTVYPRSMAPRRAFTLIELLVTLAIIGILAAILIPTVGKVRERAKIVEATADARSIMTAFKLYYATYGQWPTTNGKIFGSNNPDQSDWGKDAENSDGETVWDFITSMFKGGLGYDPDGRARNPQKVAFAPFPEDKIVDGNIVDPWGNPYKFKLDVDNDGRIPRFLEAHLDDPEKDQVWVGDTVIVWSRGPDGADWRKEEAEDDPKTW